MSSLKFMNDPDVTPEDAVKVINALAAAGTSGQIAAGAAAVVGAAGFIERTLANIWAAVSITGAGSDSDVLMGQVNIPDGAMGPNSTLVILPAWQWTNNANTKTFDVWIGQSLASKTNIYNRGRTTNASEVPHIRICNRGSKNSQLLPLSAHSNFGTNIPIAAETRTIDFSLPGMKIFFTGRLQNTADSLILNGYTASIINPGQ